VIIYKAKLWSSLSKTVVGLELKSIKTNFSDVDHMDSSGLG